MPFHIDRFFGSPAVQAMPPNAQMGYLSLLTRGQWQSEDGTISSDPLELAEKSGLGDELWAIHGPRILRNFEPVNGNGRLRNLVNFQEWQEAQRVFEARRKAAMRTNKERSADGDRAVTDTVRARPADTITGTITGTKEQKPSRAKTARAAKPRKPIEPGDAKEPTKTEIAKKRHADFKGAIKNYWDAKNPGIDMPWGAREGAQLDMLLREAPHITLDQFIGFLRNRFKSQVNHGDRPCRWIRWITSYGPGPVNQYKNTENGGNGNGAGKTQSSPAKDRVNANRRALAEIAIERGWFAPDGDSQSNGEAVPESGLDGRDTGIHDRHRASGPEILPPEG